MRFALQRIPRREGRPSYLRLLPTALTAAFALLGAGCSDETTSPVSGTGPTCGAGTQLVDNVCVGTNTNTTTCGTGTKLQGTSCVPESTPTEITCGAGTSLQGDTCIADEVTLVSCGEGTVLSGDTCLPESTITCGEGTVLSGDSCVPASTLSCGDGTVEANGACMPTALEPGRYMAAMVHLQRAYNPMSNHQHLDEVRYRDSDKKLFVCSYGFDMIDAKDPGSLKYVTGANWIKVSIPPGGISNPKYPTGTRTGGCINLDWDDSDTAVVYTTHKGNIDDPAYLGGWRLTPSGSSVVATQLPMLQEPGVSYEGIDYSNGYIYVALHEDGLGVFQRNPAGDALTRVATLGGLENAITVRVQGTTAFVADGLGGLATVDVTNPLQPTLIGQLVTGGQVRDLRVNGNTVYLAAGSEGVFIVDASNLANPVVVGQAQMPGSAIRLDYDSNRVYVAAWNDARVYDVTNPAAPVLLGIGRMTEQLSGTTVVGQDDRPEVTNRVLGIAGRGDTVFAGAWHTPHTFRLHGSRLAPFIYLPENLNLFDFGPTAVGATTTSTFDINNDGNMPLTVTDAWVDNSAFSVTPHQVRVDPGSSATLTISYTATTTNTESGIINVSSDDPAQPLRKGWLVGNQVGTGVGSPLPPTTVTTVDGATWDSTEHAGQVMMLAYFATF
jgi:hypothetical protein